MPEPKAQLVDPQGPIDVPGINATGIITATGGFVGAVQGTATGFAATTYNLNVGVVTSTGFVGDVTGTASSVTKGTNLSLGIVTASSFAGDVFGNAAGLSTTTAGLKLGIVSATSFAGNFTGIGSGITGTPNIQAGIMTATSFAGNFTGLASGITGTPNLMVGILTGTSYSGDGSNLTGIAATNWIANNVTANSSTTTVDLALGNVVKFTQSADTTVSFANTGTSNIVTFLRIKDSNDTERTLTWPSSIKWNNGSPPTLDKVNKTGEDFNLINLLTRDEGVTWYGWESASLNETGDFLFTWGGNNWAQLGLNEYGQPASRSSPTQVGSDVTWSKITHGRDYTTAAIKTDGTLWVWGLQGQGALGQNNNTNYSSPIQIPGITNWSDVDGGWRKFLAVTDTGKLFAWGYGYQGGLGINQSPGNSDRSSPTQIPGLQWSDKFATGGGPSNLSAAIRTNGTLFTWGTGGDGALGHNNKTNYSSPKQVPGTTWASITIANSSEYMLATKTDGSLWSWGKQDQGELGLNQGGDNHFSSPKQVGSDTTWANGKDQIAAGRQMSFAIKTDGTLWSWGYNYHGALGISASPGSAGRKSSPTQVPGTTWSKIHCSLYTTIATKTDGTLWAWGRNNLGQLAQVGEDNNDSNSPVQIPGTSWNDISSSAYGMGATQSK